jgi:F-type H+-transporting ATPase subunit alpha
VIGIFAGTRGYLDEIPTPKITAFEAKLLAHFRREHPAILQELAEKKVMSDELAEKIGKVVADFRTNFLAEVEAS